MKVLRIVESKISDNRIQDNRVRPVVYACSHSYFFIGHFQFWHFRRASGASSSRGYTRNPMVSVFQSISEAFKGFSKSFMSVPRGSRRLQKAYRTLHGCSKGFHGHSRGVPRRFSRVLGVFKGQYECSGGF